MNTKQEKQNSVIERITLLEECVNNIEKELLNTENDADIRMYQLMRSEYKNLIYQLKNQ